MRESISVFCKFCFVNERTSSKSSILNVFQFPFTIWSEQNEIINNWNERKWKEELQTNRRILESAQTMKPDAARERTVLMIVRACERSVATAELKEGLNKWNKIKKQISQS
jgi:hypothetical protein